MAPKSSQEQPTALCTKCNLNPRATGQRWCKDCRTSHAAEQRNAKPAPKSKKISSLTQDPNNANKGTKKGRKAILESFQELGAGRSVLIDKHGVIIAGNKSTLAAATAGIENVRIIQTDGTELIAVQRMDLDLATDAKAKKLAIAENRTTELDLSWDQDVLDSLSAEIDLGNLFPPAPPGRGAGHAEQYAVIIACKTEAEQTEAFARLQRDGFDVSLAGGPSGFKVTTHRV
jgi:hypothetical protein